MRFRLPTQLKEKITIIRKSAFERATETIIATDVICMIIPRTDIVQVVDGTGISDVEWAALLEIPTTIFQQEILFVAQMDLNYR